MKRAAIFTSIFLLIGLLLTPCLSLILPQKLRDHTYRELMMHVISKHQTRGIRDPSKQALKLFYFCAKNTFQNPGDLKPYDDKALGYLVNGSVYCDYAADILASLCAHKGLPARYCMLMDESGVSPHTLSEVKLGGKWRVLDPAEICFYTLADGRIATLDDLSCDPRLIYQSRRLLKIKELRPDEYEAKVSWYGRLFPLKHAPQRSGSKTRRITLFDRIGALYYDLFKNIFFRPYQEAYLDIKCRDMEPMQELYYRARNYQLSGRLDEALGLYDELIRSSAGIKGVEKAVLYKAFIHMDERGDFRQAIEILAPLANRQENIYAKYALFYTGVCYRAMGDKKRAGEYFNRSGVAVYLDQELAN